MTHQLSAVLVAAAVACAFFFCTWVWGLVHGQDFSVTDVYYGFSPITQGGVVYVLWHEHSGRGGVLLVLAGLWSVGLGQLLISRVRANHSFGGEPRFLMALERFELGKHLWWVSLVVLVVFQSVFVTVLNLPLLMVLTSQVHGVAAIDLAGFVVVAAGAAIEILANHQLEVFRNDPANKSKGKTLNTGLWGWSRHPNYFGNVLCYWGFFLVAVHEPHLWYTAAGPLAIYGLLRFGSGVRLTEWMMLQKRQGDSVYLDYLARTSPFLLRPPRRPSAAATKIAGVEPQSATGSGASTPLH